ncbi:hypothetical protein CIL05_15405 [Virgibacillus profundi]|uniref:Uncharacterized protein n=1 Tax=Virgibacillus profundi TaxID=2024555 RepID=A0A2A2IAL8_9BACI|nr:endospore germination permease [Virgibacillus profundi]PAV28677.1 hypothetical protein CIL05_15405 [Virgibacillus profundi]PXY52845.1 hypothetical protein CIT14_15535 [Virgibacillus profundi]
MARQISISQFIIIFLLSTGLSNHVLVVPLIIDVAGRDAWISVIVGFLMIIPFLFIVLYVTKQLKNTSVFEWLEVTYSNTIRKIVAGLLVIFLFIAGFTTAWETVSWTHDTYLLNTPMLVVAFSILAASLYIAGRVNVIAICAGILLPFVVFLGVLVAVGTIPDKNYSLILPVLVEQNWTDVFKGSIYVFGSLSEIFMLIMLQHQIMRKVAFRHLFLLSFVLFILVMGPLLGSIAIFGVEEAGKIKYPAFLQWRILSIGQYFNHLDFFSIYQWLSGSFIRLALILYLIAKAFKFKKPIIIQVLICILYLVLISAPISDMQFVAILKDYFYLTTCIFAIVMTVFLAILVRKSKNRMTENEK